MLNSMVHEELLLVWKQPKTRERYLIGWLSRDQEGYRFEYERLSPRSINDACAKGFRLLESFPEVGGFWRAKLLFPVFRRRLPQKWTLPSLQAQGIHTTEPMELLRVTGGRLPTDTLEFLEPIKTRGDDEKGYEVHFPVAGWRYYDGESVVGGLHPGMKLRLELEPENEFDPNAIKILSLSGVHLGYVPAIYAWYLDESVKNGSADATVARVGRKDDVQQRVIVRVKGVTSPLGGVRLVPKGFMRYAAALVTGGIV